VLKISYGVLGWVIANVEKKGILDGGCGYCKFCFVLNI